MQKFRVVVSSLIIALSFGASVFAADIKDQSKPEGTEVKRIDINTATEEQLKSIPGIDGESARNIINGRPYSKIEHLKTKKTIDADLYDKINKLIRALC